MPFHSMAQTLGQVFGGGGVCTLGKPLSLRAAGVAASELSMLERSNFDSRKPLRISDTSRVHFLLELCDDVRPHDRLAL